MKNILGLIIAATLITFTACDYNGKNFPGYNKDVPTDIRTVEYTMTDDDYGMVASNAGNKAMAKQEGVEKALAAVASKKAFNKQIKADKYAPVVVAYRFPVFDDGTAVKLTYKYIEEVPKPLYTDTIAASKPYTLNKNDYDTAYTTASDTAYFKSVAQVKSNMGKILKGKFPAATPDSMILVTYDLKVSGATVTTTALWRLVAAQWSEYVNASVYIMQKADYTSMNLKYDNFSGTQADSYLPVFLKSKYPYMAADKKLGIVYKHFNSGKTTIKVDEYVYDGSVWAKVPNAVEETHTDQFVKLNGKWVYNPSVALDLSGQSAEVQAYYQAAVDWVWENIDQPAGCSAKGQGYVTSFGNSDYYGGMTARYNNVDLNVTKAREQTAASTIEAIKNAYPASMTDEQVEAKMKQQLIAELNGMLQKMHPDAVPVEGIDVIYTIKLPFYRKNSHSIQYKVTAKGKFEYVEGSFKDLGK